MTEVEVWWGRIGQVREDFTDDLDPIERRRYAAYLRAEDRARFLLGCTIVRRALSHRLSLPPASIRLDRTCPDCGQPHGKVRVDGAELSVTHSGDLVGVAISDRPVGLDVEKVDPGIDVDGLAQVSLADVEIAALAGYDAGERVRAFTTYWTRKEAVVKATGEGIRAELRTVIVSRPDQPPRVVERTQNDGSVRLIDLEPDAEYVAALATLSAEPAVVRTESAQVLI
ncbi:4'-phosphopantetheinyl transferase family protein [Kribbella swartbergensis]